MAVMLWHKVAIYLYLYLSKQANADPVVSAAASWSDGGRSEAPCRVGAGRAGLRRAAAHPTNAPAGGTASSKVAPAPHASLRRVRACLWCVCVHVCGSVRNNAAGSALGRLGFSGAALRRPWRRRRCERGWPGRRCLSGPQTRRRQTPGRRP
ncbi:MAG: hypothetical protein J3K34DRAFT_408479 [Monoraphidium minutum]|nr:MAG: hypothetical protein J3K34DRAFT_408479 [Monoraphidium minutum]